MSKQTKPVTFSSGLYLQFVNKIFKRGVIHIFEIFNTWNL